MNQAQKLNRALDLLGEIMSQPFFSDALWDYKELRRWKRKAERLLESEGRISSESGDIDGN